MREGDRVSREILGRRREPNDVSEIFCVTYDVKPLFHLFTCSKYVHYSSGSCSQTGISLATTLHSNQTGGEEVTHHQVS